MIAWLPSYYTRLYISQSHLPLSHHILKCVFFSNHSLNLKEITIHYYSLLAFRIHFHRSISQSQQNGSKFSPKCCTALCFHSFGIGSSLCWGSIQILWLDCYLWWYLSPWSSPKGSYNSLLYQLSQHSLQYYSLCVCVYIYSYISFYVLMQGILINGLFPGPNIYAVTNDNLIINVQNKLPEPFLISWWDLHLYYYFLCFINFLLLWLLMTI